jgi:predicted regulator of Ras-like GTPase activity (Roadblock/LC7/MglB family)
MTGGDSNRTRIRLQDPGAVAEVLGRVRADVPDIDGAVLTSRDGLLIAAELDPGMPDADAVGLHASAMAAAAVGVGSRLVEFTNRGHLNGALFDGDRGCVGVYPVSSTIVLVLFGRSGVNPGSFTVAARKAMALLLSP